MRPDSRRTAILITGALSVLLIGGACADDSSCDCDLDGFATLEDLNDYVKKGASEDYDALYVNEGQPSAITTPMLADGAIVDGSVAADAAIAGTKVQPNFGTSDVITQGLLGIGTDAPDYALHISQSGPAFLPEFGLVSQPTVLVENPDDGGDPDADKFPGIAVANYGNGHPYVMLAAANGSKDAPEAFQGPRSMGAWIGRAHNGEDFVEAARLSFVAESTFAPGVNPTTMRFELGDADPNTPDKLTRMVITSTGRVGIGNPAPQATLDVKGYARLEAHAAAPVACSTTNAGSIALTSNYRMCACNGSQWAFTHDGQVCVW